MAADRWGGILLLAALPAVGLGCRRPDGVVVVAIEPGTTAAVAGLAPGDVIENWTAGLLAGGSVGSPFDLISPFLEDVPRRRVVLSGRRGGLPRTWILPRGFPSPWNEMELRPSFSSGALARYEQGRILIAQGRLDEGIEVWRQLEASPAVRSRGLAFWVSAQRAKAFAEAERWDDADRLYGELLAPRKTGPSGDPVVAQLLREWGAAAVTRRIWDLAENRYRRALALDRMIAPESLAAAQSLVGLGEVESWSAGAEDPAELFQDALAILERRAPASSAVAATWQAWGRDAASNGDWALAARLYRKAVQAEEKATSQGRYLAERLMRQGEAEYFLDRPGAAEALWHRALSHLPDRSPESWVKAAIFQGLGHSAKKDGDLRGAATWFRRSLALVEPMRIDRLLKAGLLQDLGGVEAALEEREAAAGHLCRGLALQEQSRRLLAASFEAQRRWTYWFSESQRACADALVNVGEAERAFEVVESGRARAFLQDLAVRDLRRRPLPDPAAARKARLHREYEVVLRRLARLEMQRQPVQTQLWSLQGKLREIERDQDRLLRELFPRELGALPEPFDLARARRTLDPGTSLLVFSTAENRTLLFLVRPAKASGTGLTVLPIAVSAEQLRRQVALFRRAIVAGRPNRRESQARGKALYDLMLRPAEPYLQGSERLLISPDGPLHFLPFAALVRGDSYLIEKWPLHFVLSATVYHELKERRQRGATDRTAFVGFGDPVFTPAGEALETTGDVTLRGALEQGLAPLPNSRSEVLAIARLFEDRQVYLGAAASERRVKSLKLARARRLHFAVHGLYNERRPASSALVLSRPGRRETEEGNGLLQSWEVKESLDLEGVELVTLSACDSALGREQSGEGLLGLTQAFQYAGARSVLAALWGVPDRTTPRLMVRFYAGLKAGQSLDRALRAAQLHQIREPQAGAPFFWATFQLYGDWR